MFLDNKYSTWYWSIINYALNRNKPSVYTERHHITPRCMGGLDSQTNLVFLTAREHFICHRLLTRMTVGEFKRKLTYAAWQLSRSASKRHKVRISARTYDMLRIQLANEYKGLGAGRKIPANVIAKRVKTLKDNYTPEMRAARSSRFSGAGNGMWGRSHSSDTIKRIKDSLSLTTSTAIICHQTGIKYQSQMDAARDLGLKQGDISNVLGGRQRSTKGYSFSYIDQ